MSAKGQKRTHAPQQMVRSIKSGVSHFPTMMLLASDASWLGNIGRVG